MFVAAEMGDNCGNRFNNDYRISRYLNNGVGK